MTSLLPRRIGLVLLASSLLSIVPMLGCGDDNEAPDDGSSGMSGGDGDGDGDNGASGDGDGDTMCSHQGSDLDGGWRHPGTPDELFSCIVGGMIWFGDHLGEPVELMMEPAPCHVRDSGCGFSCVSDDGEITEGTLRLDSSGALHLEITNCQSSTCSVVYMRDEAVPCGE